jgi:predicted Zn-dependent protease
MPPSVNIKPFSKQSPSDAPAYLGLANTYWKFGRVQDTMAALAKLLALSPGDPEGNAIMASLLVSEHQMQAAKPFAERAITERPDLSIAHMALAKIYLSENQPSQALPELRKAAPDDTDGSYHYVLAETLRKLGQMQEATIALQKSRQLRQNQVAQNAH